MVLNSSFGSWVQASESTNFASFTWKWVHFKALSLMSLSGVVLVVSETTVELLPVRTLKVKPVRCRAALTPCSRVSCAHSAAIIIVWQAISLRIFISWCCPFLPLMKSSAYPSVASFPALLWSFSKDSHIKPVVNVHIHKNRWEGWLDCITEVSNRTDRD